MTSTVQLTNDHQQQQQIYMMYQDNQSIDMDGTHMDFDGHVAHTAQAAPITVNIIFSWLNCLFCVEFNAFAFNTWTYFQNASNGNANVTKYVPDL